MLFRTFPRVARPSRCVVAFALLALAGALVLSEAPSAHAAIHSVNVGQDSNGLANFRFNPAASTAVKGDTVHWSWFNGNHTVVSYQESSPGVPQWQSPVLTMSGDSFDHTFPTGGTFTYYCSIHSSRLAADPANVDANIAAGGMVGKITVSSVVGGISLSPDPATLTDSRASSNSRTKEIAAVGAAVFVLLACVAVQFVRRPSR